ncbi:phosphoribosyltransferase [Pasteurella multocida]
MHGADSEIELAEIQNDMFIKYNIADLYTNEFDEYDYEPADEDYEYTLGQDLIDDITGLEPKNLVDVLTELGEVFAEIFSISDEISVDTDKFSFRVVDVKYEFGRTLCIDSDGSKYNLEHCHNPSIRMTPEAIFKYTKAAYVAKIKQLQDAYKQRDDMRRAHRENNERIKADMAEVLKNQEEARMIREKMLEDGRIYRCIHEHSKTVRYIDNYSKPSKTDYGTSYEFTDVGNEIHLAKYYGGMHAFDAVVSRARDLLYYEYCNYIIPAPSSNGSSFVHRILQNIDFDNTPDTWQYLDCIIQVHQVDSVKSSRYMSSLDRYYPRVSSYEIADGCPDLNHKVVIVFDDMISTGATTYAIKKLLESAFPYIELKFFALAKTYR